MWTKREESIRWIEGGLGRFRMLPHILYDLVLCVPFGVESGYQVPKLRPGFFPYARSIYWLLGLIVKEFFISQHKWSFK